MIRLLAYMFNSEKKSSNENLEYVQMFIVLCRSNSIFITHSKILSPHSPTYNLYPCPAYQSKRKYVVSIM